MVATSVVIAGAMTGYHGQHSTIEALTDGIERELVSTVSASSHAAEAEFSFAPADLRFVRRVPPIQGVLRADDNNGVDPQDESTSEQWRTRLGTIFESLLHARPNYVEVAYLTADGGAATVATRAPMIDTSGVGEDFLASSLALSGSELYASRFSPAQREGRIVDPPPCP